MLTRAIGVKWDHPKRYRAAPGEAVSERHLRLNSGIVEVAFGSGALVTIEGPAKLRIDSEMKCFSHYGKLSANCPPSAHGFTVRFRGGRVVDLGTEFAMESEPKGKTEVHVLNGEVIVALTDDDENVLKEQNLTGNVAVRLNPDDCLLYTSPSPRDLSTSRMPSSA